MLQGCLNGGRTRLFSKGIIAVLDRAGLSRPRLLHGFETTQWPLFREALVRGYDGRIGLEDGALLPSGERAADNAALLAAARQMSQTA